MVNSLTWNVSCIFMLTKFTTHPKACFSMYSYSAQKCFVYNSQELQIKLFLIKSKALTCVHSFLHSFSLLSLIHLINHIRFARKKKMFGFKIIYKMLSVLLQPCFFKNCSVYFRFAVVVEHISHVFYTLCFWFPTGNSLLVGGRTGIQTWLSQNVRAQANWSSFAGWNILHTMNWKAQTVS